MDEDNSDSDRNQDISLNKLEKILVNGHSIIKIRKNQEPILDIKKEGYSSIRNPAAFIYKNKIGLLYTVRTSLENSSLYLAWSDNGKDFILENKPFIELDKDSKLATEDARITRLNGEYWISFTAVKEKTPKGDWVLRVGHVKTRNFKTYYDRQIILDDKEENKNALFFKNGGYHFIIDRPYMKNENETPGAEIAKVKNLNPLIFGKFRSYLSPREDFWDNARVGINTPPITIRHEKYGNCLFMLYHGAQKEDNNYGIGYIIADNRNPLKILERSKEPLLNPELDFETGKGNYPPEIPNVIFGCGAIPISKNTIRFYYSGADRYPNFADLSLINSSIRDKTFSIIP